MLIPEYWSKAIAEQTDRKGRKKTFCCWRSSEESEADAHESALAAAKRILERLTRGEHLAGYGYGETPLREEVIQRFTGPDDELRAAVTRNAYGALVLNTARVMFIDVDFPELMISPLELLKRIFRFSRRSDDRDPAAQYESDAVGKLEQYVREHPGWAVRAYRTCWGVRGMVTHDLFDPTAEVTQAVFSAVRADPLYVRLCNVQKSFRARLTPKPWRCRCHRHSVTWPREDALQEDRFQKWLATYDARQSDYATCRFIRTLGGETVHPEVSDIIEIHDKLTRCHEPLRLA
jgi:hypothetical protein